MRFRLWNSWYGREGLLPAVWKRAGKFASSKNGSDKQPASDRRPDVIPSTLAVMPIKSSKPTAVENYRPQA